MNQTARLVIRRNEFQLPNGGAVVGVYLLGHPVLTESFLEYRFTVFSPAVFQAVDVEQVATERIGDRQRGCRTRSSPSETCP